MPLTASHQWPRYRISTRVLIFTVNMPVYPPGTIVTPCQTDADYGLRIEVIGKKLTVFPKGVVRG